MTDETIFATAREQADPAARAAYLTEACAGDPDRRRRVEGLLAAHEKAGEFLEKPPTPLADPDRMPTQDLGVPETDPSEPDDALTFLTPSTRPDSLGRIGHYEVLQVLGKGGFGIVFRAFDETLQRVVAIKVLSGQVAAASPARKRFLREARSSAKVRHEHIVQIYAVEDQPLPYLVMEFIPGETLQQRLDRTGPLETAEVVQFGRQLAEGLAAAHGMGLIHRDIKPGNILIEASANPCVKITDFGLARAADDASLTQSGTIAGTPMFMAPEQAQGDKLDHRADLFSLGSVLYTMCSGRPPFRANSTLAVLKRVAEDTPRPIPEIIPEVPQWLCDLITRLHAKKPEDRLGTAQEVADLLARGLAAMQQPGNVPPAAGRKNPPVRAIPKVAPASKARPRTRRWAAAAAVFLLLLAGFGFTEATGVTKVRGTVIRLFSPEGTLVVEVDDPAVSIQIDGSDLVIKGAGAKEIRLKPGSYTVEARKDGKVVSRELITVTKNGRQVVRVSQEAPPDAKAAKEKKDPDRRAAEYVLSMGGTVRVNDENGDRKAVADLPPEAFRLTLVDLQRNSQVSDAGLANFKNCKNLTELYMWGDKQVTDKGLANFKGCKGLTALELGGTQVSDAGLASFKDCKNLKALYLSGTKVTDTGLALFKDCKNLTHFIAPPQLNGAGLKDLKTLTTVHLHYSNVSDAALLHFKDSKDLGALILNDTKVSDAGLAHLKGCNNLTDLQLQRTKVTAAGIDGLKKALPKCRIQWDGGVIEPRVDAAEWERSVAAMPAAEQVKAVAARLKELNPGFDGKVTPTIEKGVVTGLQFLTDEVDNIAPVRALKGLTSLVCGGTWARGRNGEHSLSDVSPLKGMPLNVLNCGTTRVADLTPLKGMPLRSLNVWTTKVSNLSPLKGMPLTALVVGCTEVSDLSPLKGMPLNSLWCQSTGVADLTPLKDAPLTDLLCGNTLVSDLAPLRGMRLTRLHLGGTKVADLAPLKGMPLIELMLPETSVADLTPLKGMLLEEIRLTPKNITRGLEILRDMKSLKTIGIGGGKKDWPAPEFWDRYDKGEFKK